MTEVRGATSCNSLNCHNASMEVVGSTSKLDLVDMDRSSKTSEDDTLSELGLYKKSSSWSKFGFLRWICGKLRRPRIYNISENQPNVELKSIEEVNPEVRRHASAETDLQDAHRLVEGLKERVRTLEAQFLQEQRAKEEALTRLSALASAKLRDNNPSIADLSDNYRPTKLAEMYSELYDNEWTNAFCALEEKFSEAEVISFLLEIIMASYLFCCHILEDNWDIVSTWYLNQDFPWYVETSKCLKDGRKLNIPELSNKVIQDYKAQVEKKFSRKLTGALLRNSSLQKYIAECVRLCLLMGATDPPVVINCPGWDGSCREAHTADHSDGGTSKAHMSDQFNSQTTQDVGNGPQALDEDSDKSLEEYELLVPLDEDFSKDNHAENQMTDLNEDNSDSVLVQDLKVVDTSRISANDEDNSSTNSREEDFEDEEIETPADPVNEQSNSVDRSEDADAVLVAYQEPVTDGAKEHVHVGKGPFRKDVYKEYTKSGRYLDYVVWPVMFLHEGGPILVKGVAQGTNG